MPYRYAAFGLCLQSDFPLPECLPDPAVGDVPAADVTIRYADAPPLTPSTDTTIHHGVLYAAQPQQFYYALHGVATYRADDGHSIRVQPAPDADAASVRAFLLGPVMGALLHQRGVLLLHASAVQLGERTALIMGEAATGKSLLAAALWRRGHRVLADDLAVITRNTDGAFVVQPEYPHLLLHPPALKLLGLSPDEYPPLRPHVEKRRVPLEDAYQPQPQRVDQIYMLTREPRAALSLEAVRGVQVFNQLGNGVYHMRFLRGMGDDGRVLRLMPRLAQQTRVQALHYRIAHDAPDAIAAALEHDTLLTG